MADSYNFSDIEAQWQAQWARAGVFRMPDTSDRPKSYVLDMFPYPSGSGLHVGHVKGYIATDVFARYMLMQGHDVLHPMGWDAFGLPAENYALKNKVHPRLAVEANVARYKEQLSQIGFTYDWEREINTTDPAYYKWTQWIFVQLFKRGLAYESHEPINWCPSCKTGLANEDVEDGRCERCGTPVEKKRLRQWVLKITEYAERLLKDIEGLDWPESIKESQRNWIGRSEGAEIKFQISNFKFQIPVFTTRADTLFGATYLVVAPEHELVTAALEQGIVENTEEVQAYVEAAAHKTDLMRQEDEKEKTGVELKGVTATNPASGEEVPVWVADYVLMSYGTGAIMAVPAHDERDWGFATKYNLPIKMVVCPHYPAPTCPVLEEAYTAPGHLVESGDFTGLSSEEAKQAITKQVGGELKVMYKLRDWVFSRQRYWGEPIPLVFCEACKTRVENFKFQISNFKKGTRDVEGYSEGELLNPGWIAIDEGQLPVALPEVDSYEPSGTGESPLATIPEWVHTTCPKCGGEAQRETNTMPQWAGSSWYYLRYISPQNDDALVDADAEKYWMPVDMYVGGAEHATRHLIYARFWHKVLFDIGAVSTDEPFMRLQHVGLITGEDGRKMSKRWGNVVNPDDVVAEFGADTLRVYEMFMGPFDQSAAWTTSAISGAHRFLKRVWQLIAKNAEAEEGELSADANVALQRTIKRVTESTDGFRFNTAVAALMEFLNMLEKEAAVPRNVLSVYVQLLAPYAPHLTEELWQRLGHDDFIVRSTWPQYDEAVLAKASVTLPVQVNGRVRGNLTVEPEAQQADIEPQARELANVARHLEGKEIARVVYVPGRMINFVTK